jgi:hypothetical protein
MKSLLDTGKHSDFVIVCGDDTYNVHKSIICSQCSFFDAASRFDKEAEEGKIDLADDEPEIVKYFIQYLYELDYHIPSEKLPGPWAFQFDWDATPDIVDRTGHLSPGKKRKMDKLMWQASTTFMANVLEAYPGLYTVCIHSFLPCLQDCAWLTTAGRGAQDN